jgi:DNA-binding NarL/FixJ family response regulator
MGVVDWVPPSPSQLHFFNDSTVDFLVYMPYVGFNISANSVSMVFGEANRLQPGDTILQLGGMTAESIQRDYSQGYYDHLKPGQTVAITLLRQGQQITIPYTLAGGSGYILKDDRAAMLELVRIVRLVHNGGIYFSQAVGRLIMALPGEGESLLTARQAEVLSYCAAYPQVSTAQMAQRLNIAPSTLHNLLSGAHLRLEVPNRAAAIARARQLGLISLDHL